LDLVGREITFSSAHTQKHTPTHTHTPTHVKQIDALTFHWQFYTERWVMSIFT